MDKRQPRSLRSLGHFAKLIQWLITGKTMGVRPIFFSNGLACLRRFFVDIIAGQRHEFSRWNLGNTAAVFGVLYWH